MGRVKALNNSLFGQVVEADIAELSWGLLQLTCRIDRPPLVKWFVPHKLPNQAIACEASKASHVILV